LNTPSCARCEQSAWLIFIQRNFSQRIYMLQNSIAIVASQ